MRGRKPVENPHTHQKRTPRPKLPASRPRCPRHLSVEARGQWRELAGELESSGRMSPAFASVLASAAVAAARCLEVQAELATEADPKRALSLARLLNTCLQSRLRYLAELGLTPARSPNVGEKARQTDYERFVEEGMRLVS